MPEFERIIFDFVGGPRDGERLCGELRDDGCCSAATTLYRTTEGARVGAQFRFVSEYTARALRVTALAELEALESAGCRFQGHQYEIFARREHCQTVLVRARYLGAGI